MTPERRKQVLSAVRHLRTTWRAGNRPARQLFDIAVSHGVLVFRMALTSDVSGAFVRSKRGGRAVIIVNTHGKNTNHQRFTLAHELAHLCLHQEKDGLVEHLDPAVQARNPEDREANLFADELLVPLEELKRELNSRRIDPLHVSDRSVVELAQTFAVSQHVILWRLRLVNGSSYEDMLNRLRETNWNDAWRRYAPDSREDTVPQGAPVVWRPEGVSEETARAVSRFPDAYREMAFEAYRRNLITGRKLAEILGIEDGAAVAKELRPLLKPESAGADKELEEALAKLGQVKDD